MNFLAHMYLSFNNEEIMIGNYIADFVKGKQINQIPDSIQKGILLHREIDRYTDSHEIVKLSKKRLVTKYRHYASVIIDIFYDHFLARNWDQYSSESLKKFTSRNYEILNKRNSIIPDKALYVLTHMSATDWLYNYQFLDGIEMALRGMARRTKFDSRMENSIADLKYDYDLYNNEFEAFFAQITSHSKNYLEYLNTND